jgi:hypothetical protein
MSVSGATRWGRCPSDGRVGIDTCAAPGRHERATDPSRPGLVAGAFMRGDRLQRAGAASNRGRESCCDAGPARRHREGLSRRSERVVRGSDWSVAEAARWAPAYETTSARSQVSHAFVEWRLPARTGDAYHGRSLQWSISWHRGLLRRSRLITRSDEESCFSTLTQSRASSPR